jgi:TolB protein
MYALGLLYAVSAAPVPPLKSTQLLYPIKQGDFINLFLVDITGGAPKQLTATAAADIDPAWSPDGKQIAFTSDHNRVQQLYVMDADGRNVRPLAQQANVTDRLPAWSPDGKKIAFRRELGNAWQIHVMDADGSNLVNLSNNRGRDSDPAWSPDGKKFAFASNRGGGYRTYVMDADGSNVTVFSESDSPWGANYPGWSPDGKKLYYSDVGGDSLEIFVCNADGTDKKQLTKLGGLNTRLACAPDGEKIAFQHSTPGAEVASLYVMDRNGNNLKEVVKEKGAVFGGRPAWKPR